MSTILNELVKIREKLDSDGTYSGSTAGVPETVTQIRELVENGAGGGSGGVKKFEIEGDGLNFVVKATPEEMEVGALAVSEGPIHNQAYMCMYKGLELFENKPYAVFISTYGDDEIRTFRCKYDETQGGYVYGISGDDTPPIS